RPAVVAPRGNLSQRQHRIQDRNSMSYRLDAAGFDGYRLSDFGKQHLLDLADTLFGSEDLGFVLFEFGRGVTLGVGKSLSALIIGGDVFYIRLADFNKVSEHVVELHLHGRDPGARPLTGFDRRDKA